MLEAKAFLLSPADQGVVISLKHTMQKTLHSLKWLCSVFQMVRGARLELARCNHTPLKRARLPIPLPAQNAAPPLCCKRAVRGKAIPGLCCYVREGSCFTLLKRKFRLQSREKRRFPSLALPAGLLCAGIPLSKTAGSSVPVTVRGYMAAHDMGSPPAGKAGRAGALPCRARRGAHYARRHHVAHAARGSTRR